MVGESMNGWRNAAAGDGSDSVLTEERPPAGSFAAHPDRQVDEQRRRRRAAEAAADAAEAAAADAAARASVAIAAAARAAAEAEAAADLAARTADEAEAAAAAERQAVARAHAANALTANETTAIGIAPVAGGHAAAEPRANGARHQVRDEPSVNVPGPSLPQDDAVVAGAPTAMISPVGAPGGRAARRRAQEAAAAVAREATRDPDTHVIALDGDGPGDAPSHRSRRAKARPGTGGRIRSLFGRVRNKPGGRVVLAAAAVGGVILLAAVAAGLVDGSRGPSNAAVVAAGPTSAETSSTESATGSGGTVDTTTPEAVAYLEALRAADVPTSASGQAETEAAAVICEQIAGGADAADMVRALPAVLPTLNSKQAKTVVSIAQKKYCS